MILDIFLKEFISFFIKPQEFDIDAFKLNNSRKCNCSTAGNLNSYYFIILHNCQNSFENKKVLAKIY